MKIKQERAKQANRAGMMQAGGLLIGVAAVAAAAPTGGASLAALAAGGSVGMGVGGIAAGATAK